MIAYRSKPWPGVTGDIALSATLDDVGEVSMARFEDGKWDFLTRKELEVPRGYIPARDRVTRTSANSAGGKE